MTLISWNRRELSTSRNYQNIWLLNWTTKLQFQFWHMTFDLTNSGNQTYRFIYFFPLKFFIFIRTHQIIFRMIIKFLWFIGWASDISEIYTSVTIKLALKFLIHFQPKINVSKYIFFTILYSCVCFGIPYKVRIEILAIIIHILPLLSNLSQKYWWQIWASVHLY